MRSFILILSNALCYDAYLWTNTPKPFHIICFRSTCLYCVNILGIFAYLNYVSPRTREEIINILITGLKRLEYRGYDSAGTNSSVSLP